MRGVMKDGGVCLRRWADDESEDGVGGEDGLSVQRVRGVVLE